jgi:hypothetical protein
MSKLKTLKWFRGKVGLKIYRDDGGCGCHHCNEIVENGLIVHDAVHAEHLYDMQNEYAYDGTYLNYRDIK